MMNFYYKMQPYNLTTEESTDITAEDYFADISQYSSFITELRLDYQKVISSIDNLITYLENGASSSTAGVSSNNPSSKIAQSTLAQNPNCYDPFTASMTISVSLCQDQISPDFITIIDTLEAYNATAINNNSALPYIGSNSNLA